MEQYDIPIFYSYGKLESDREFVTNSVVKQGDFTLVIHPYGHNIPRFIDEDMKIFGNFLKRVYRDITFQEIDIGM